MNEQDREIMLLEERKLKEIEHSDRRRAIVRAYEYRTDMGMRSEVAGVIADNESYHKHFSNMKFYSITRISSAYRDSLLLNDIKGKTCLDYCCGNGEVAVEMARQGARSVCGIDISKVGIENAQELAKQFGVSDCCNFMVMDAEHTDFPDDSFDIIHEYGALHHLDLRIALRELSRVAKPEGKLICTEALRHNPLIHYYRKKTPDLRTQWEVAHILGLSDIMIGKQYFERVDIRFFHLASLLAVAFRNTRLFSPFLSILENLDSTVLTIPYLQKMAWIAVIVYSNPVSS